MTLEDLRARFAALGHEPFCVPARECTCRQALYDGIFAEHAREARANEGYTLWDRETGNVIGHFPTVGALAQAAFGLGQANPDDRPEDITAFSDAEQEAGVERLRLAREARALAREARADEGLREAAAFERRTP